MDAFQNVTEVHALALTLTRTMTAEELTRTALLFTQLGTTMATLAGLLDLEQGGSAREQAADLAGLA
ncbi:hypothetical protein [Dysosmobacter sp. Sow4_B12]|uniref:hypothetical protein n=1 Tax=Dysosmobacter sp. Sow4_B12 TaxID=3438777 RepID=UPI003F91B8C4